MTKQQQLAAAQRTYGERIASAWKAHDKRVVARTGDPKPEEWRIFNQARIEAGVY